MHNYRRARSHARGGGPTKRELSTKANIDRTQLELQREEANLDELVRRVLGAVQDAVQDLQVQLFQLNRQASARAEEAGTLARTGFDEGAYSALQLPDAETAFTKRSATSLRRSDGAGGCNRKTAQGDRGFLERERLATERCGRAEMRGVCPALPVRARLRNRPLSGRSGR